MTNAKYLCPFCLSSWVCEGPHIEQKDLPSFLELQYWDRVDYAETAKDVIILHGENNNIDLKGLAEIVFNKIMDRSKVSPEIIKAIRNNLGGK